MQGRTTREPAQDQLETTRRTRRTRTPPWSTQKRAGRRLALATLPPAARRKTKRRKTKYVYRPKSERHSTEGGPSTPSRRTRSARQAAERKRPPRDAAAAPGKPRGHHDEQLGRRSERFRSTIGAPTRTEHPPRASPRREVARYTRRHDHVQLLLQTYARTAWNQTPEAQLVASNPRLDRAARARPKRLMLKRERRRRTRRSGSRARTMRYGVGKQPKGKSSRGSQS